MLILSLQYYQHKCALNELFRFCFGLIYTFLKRWEGVALRIANCVVLHYNRLGCIWTWCWVAMQPVLCNACPQLTTHDRNISKGLAQFEHG